MGILDFLLGRKSSSDDSELEVDREPKAYGDLYTGGAGRVSHDLENSSEEKEERNDVRPERNISRLQDDLQTVERRARDLHVYDKQVRRKIGKVDGYIGRVGDASSPLLATERKHKLREGIRKSYGKIKEENERRLEKLRHNGASDHHIREEELKLDRIRKDMSSMYRRSGGSGMLK